ncbi:hypothetical protein ACGFW5_01190 [Streptomyces sp. NPDC048416]|uniref:hypothetical protein n=1 Tax=Streptomyces sp. NPDC048416 TaxID=3365546 RepID=UPI003717F42F
MHQFMDSNRLWAAKDSPAQEWIRPHVLWLPQDQPHVVAYLHEIAEVVTPYADIVAPVAEAEWHWTIQAARAHAADGRRIDGDRMEAAAKHLQEQLDTVAPFEIYLGPAAASRSAVITRIVPVCEAAVPDPATGLSRQVRAGLSAAGLGMAAASESHWGHLTSAYGRVDTSSRQLGDRSDRLASALVHRVRRHLTVTVDSVWLVWERQHPREARYSFERVRQVHLGGIPGVRDRTLS